MTAFYTLRDAQEQVQELRNEFKELSDFVREQLNPKALMKSDPLESIEQTHKQELIDALKKVVSAGYEIAPKSLAVIVKDFCDIDIKPGEEDDIPQGVVYTLDAEFIQISEEDAKVLMKSWDKDELGRVELIGGDAADKIGLDVVCDSGWKIKEREDPDQQHTFEDVGEGSNIDINVSDHGWETGFVVADKIDRDDNELSIIVRPAFKLPNGAETHYLHGTDFDVVKYRLSKAQEKQ